MKLIPTTFYLFLERTYGAFATQSSAGCLSREKRSWKGVLSHHQYLLAGMAVSAPECTFPYWSGSPFWPLPAFVGQEAQSESGCELIVAWVWGIILPFSLLKGAKARPRWHTDVSLLLSFVHWLVLLIFLLFISPRLNIFECCIAMHGWQTNKNRSWVDVLDSFAFQNGMLCFTFFSEREMNLCIGT